MTRRGSVRSTVGYAIVQHSAAGMKPGFSHALEERAVTDSQREKVLKAGGRVFPDYEKAEDFCQAEMYPPGSALGIYPHALGTFCSVQIDGLRVYRPPTTGVVHGQTDSSQRD